MGTVPPLDGKVSGDVGACAADSDAGTLESDGQRTVTLGKVQQIVGALAGVFRDGVVAGVIGKDVSVVACTADQGIIAAAALEGVVATVTGEGIVPAAAVEGVVPAAAGEGIVARTPVEGAAAAGHHGERIVITIAVGFGIRGAPNLEGVVPRATPEFHHHTLADQIAQRPGQQHLVVPSTAVGADLHNVVVCPAKVPGVRHPANDRAQGHVYAALSPRTADVDREGLIDVVQGLEHAHAGHRPHIQFEDLLPVTIRHFERGTQQRRPVAGEAR